MSESWSFIFNEMFYGTISLILNLLKVLIPLFIIIEVLMKFNVMEKLAKKLQGIGRIMGMSKDAVFPLMVGLFMGVTYGAGTLIELNKTNPLSKRDFALIGVFMYSCHGIIETGFLFAIAGANIFVVTVVRIFIAFIVTVIASRTAYIKRLSAVSGEEF